MLHEHRPAVLNLRSTELCGARIAMLDCVEYWKSVKVLIPSGRQGTSGGLDCSVRVRNIGNHWQRSVETLTRRYHFFFLSALNQPTKLHALNSSWFSLLFATLAPLFFYLFSIIITARLFLGYYNFLVTSVIWPQQIATCYFAMVTLPHPSTHSMNSLLFLSKSLLFLHLYFLLLLLLRKKNGGGGVEKS